MDKNTSYGIRLAVIYSIIWFVDLLDATLLNVALPEISQYFMIDPTNAEWALKRISIGVGYFLLNCLSLFCVLF